MPAAEALTALDLRRFAEGERRAGAAERDAGDGGGGRAELFRAQRVVQLFDLAGAMSLEALTGTPAAFDRAHSRGAAACRARSRPRRICAQLMEGSEIRESHSDNDPRVQDAYCLRCMPQVHGAVRGVLEHVRRWSRSRPALRRTIL